jgi:hypothetical protein
MQGSPPCWECADPGHGYDGTENSHVSNAEPGDFGPVGMQEQVPARGRFSELKAVLSEPSSESRGK